MRQYKKVRFSRSWHISGEELRSSLRRTFQVRLRRAGPELRFRSAFPSSRTVLNYVRNHIIHTLALVALIVVGSTGVASALQSSSASYGVDETFFGSGGELNACSTSYCSKQSAGETTVGNSGSANYQIQAGNNTNRDNSLEMVVNASNIDVGVLTSTSTKTASATFSVKSYLASGYSVLTHSPGPKNSNHVLQLLTTPSTSSTGSEQFGINLVANTCPANTSPSGLGGCSGGLGADPQEVPDTSFSFGLASAGYDTADSYKYADGDEIAHSNSSSGKTDYTISYLFNISGVTPGGTYTMAHVLVATSTF